MPQVKPYVLRYRAHCCPRMVMGLDCKCPVGMVEYRCDTEQQVRAARHNVGGQAYKVETILGFPVERPLPTREKV